MEPEAVTVRLGESVLCAVPSIHFGHYFAAKVNRICHEAEVRPEAIAVELGPRAAAAATAWLRELGGTHRRLPVMLGLLKEKNAVRSSLQQKAIQSLLLLSPTDSIVEALRCGIECGLPIYGVDLDDTAGPAHAEVQIQLPEGRTSLCEFVRRNEGFAASYHDEETDPGREAAMAAHLKALLERHRRVVYVCGVGHWQRLVGLLRGGALEPLMPAGAPEAADEEFRRVVVHPSIAVAFLDLYPALAQSYEAVRADGTARNPRLPFGPAWEMTVDPWGILRGLLEKTWRRHYAATATAGQRRNGDRGRDVENYGAFESYLGNLCLLRHRPLPELSAIVNAAEETMSIAFAGALRETFMDFPWAKPKDFPGCSLLGPSPEDEREPGALVLTNGRGRRIGGTIHVRLMGRSDTRPESVVTFQREDVRGKSSQRSESYQFCTWGPWERLLCALSLRAARRGTKGRITRRPVDFEGSLLGGLDIKRTTRAFSRSDERYYVRDFVRDVTESPALTDCFPVVWLLTRDAPADAEWSVYVQPHALMKDYIRDISRFEGSPAGGRNNMVSIISYGTQEQQRRLAGHGEARVERLAGFVLFLPTCLTNKQMTQWAEMTDFRSTPFCDDPCLDEGRSSDLREDYDRVHDVRLGRFSWSTTLILMALPFAKEALTVVVPGGQKIERVVHERASRCGVRVQSVPLALFPRAQVERLARCHLVPAIEYDPAYVYPEEVEDFTGEKQTDNIDLLPRCLRDFGR